MNDEQIIKMGAKVYLCDEEGRDDNSIIITDHLRNFAKLVAQHERERIFGELLKMHEGASSRHNFYLYAVLTIRARGEA